MDLLGVPPGMLAQYGAVSEEVAGAMAEGARTALGADFALSVTGVAGPDGGTEDKPVGLVYLGCAGPGGTRVRRSSFPGDRDDGAHVQRHRRAAPAAGGAHAVSRRGAGQAPPAAPLRGLRPPTGGPAGRRGLAAHGALARTTTSACCRRVHLTLAFLGGVDAERVPDLERILGGVRWRRADCRFREPLFLPAHGRRRVVALELDDPSGTLRRLQAEVSAAARDGGPLRAREAAVAAPRHGGQIPPSRSPFFPAKCQHRRIWCRPDGPV